MFVSLSQRPSLPLTWFALKQCTTGDAYQAQRHARAARRARMQDRTVHQTAQLVLLVNTLQEVARQFVKVALLEHTALASPPQRNSRFTQPRCRGMMLNRSAFKTGDS
jgi:hypothetical protein